MRRPNRTYATRTAAVLAAALLLAAPAGAQTAQPAPADPPADAQRLLDLVEQLHQARRARRAQQQQHQRELEQIQQQTRTLETQRQSLEARTRQARENARAARDRLAQLEARKAAHADRAHQLADALAPLTQSLRARVAESAAVDARPRVDTLDRIHTELQQADPSVPFLAAADLLEFLTGNLQLGRRVELASEPIVLDQPDGRRRVHAHVLRVGLLDRFFLSEDHRLAGVAKPEGWRLVEGEKADAIRQAVQVLQQRRAPSWVALPLGPQQGGRP